jgi:hypothetical protein
MEKVIQSVLNAVGNVVEKIPNLLWALAILVGGWIIAAFISKIVAVAIRKTTLDKKVSNFVGEDKGIGHLRIDQWVSKAVFYFLMLFFIVCFFQALRLDAATIPLNELLNEVTQYIPNLIGAAVLGLAAWVLATLLRLVIVRTLSKTKIDERLSEKIDVKKEKQIPLTSTLGDTTYWLVFLFFIPLILEALGLDQGLLSPIKNMFDKVIAFIPQLFAASIILLAGWLIAKIVQKVVTNLLVSFEADKFSDRVGIASFIGSQKLSRAVGTIVYVLIIIMALIEALHNLQLNAISVPLSNMLNRIALAAPNIFYAFVIVVVAYVVGKLVSELIKELLTGFGFNSILAVLGIGKEPAEKDITPSDVVARLALAGIVFFSLIEACTRLGFDILANIGHTFLIFAGDVILGIIIFGIGLYLANLSSTLLKGKGKQSNFIAFAVKICILVFAGAMALNRMGLASDIINMAFGLILGAAAVAIAISFGIGGREFAARRLEKWEKTLEEKKK